MREKKNNKAQTAVPLATQEIVTVAKRVRKTKVASAQVVVEASSLPAEPESETVGKVPASRKMRPDTYVTYPSVEAAAAALGYPLIKVADLHQICLQQSIKVARFVKAIGGDRMVLPVRSPEWKPVLVKRARYVAASCVADIQNL